VICNLQIERIWLKDFRPVRGSNPGRGEIFRAHTALRPIQPPVQLVPGHSGGGGLKRPGRGVDHLRTFALRSKKE